MKKPKPKRKRPSSDWQQEVATASQELLSGVEAMTNPNYHALNKRIGYNSRLLHAVLCAYAKHQLDCEDIGWNKLGDILCDAICETIGDKAFCDWSDRITGRGKG